MGILGRLVFILEHESLIHPSWFHLKGFGGFSAPFVLGAFRPSGNVGILGSGGEIRVLHQLQGGKREGNPPCLHPGEPSWQLQPGGVWITPKNGN